MEKKTQTFRIVLDAGNTTRDTLVAIDFGTTRSAIAWYPILKDRTPAQLVQTKPHFVEFGGQVKVPTKVLCTPEMEPVAFGQDAEDRYKQLTISGKPTT